MNRFILKKLMERKKPINVAIVGCGWWGYRVVKELNRLPNIVPKVLVDKDIKKCITAYSNIGIKKKEITIVENLEELKNVPYSQYIAFSNLSLIKNLKNIDVIHEATGDVNAGVQVALNSAEAKINFVTINCEMDATVGLILADRAKKMDLVYSNCDGDQPGCLARMLDDIISWGFEPKIVGNNKLFLDHYQNPTGIIPYVPNGQNPLLLCGVADGTKLAMELTVVANSFCFYPLKRGMYGPRTNKIDFIKTFDDLL
ncbi:hypothetical protein LCGC14_2551640, partial [marine sediment metagenome]